MISDIIQSVSPMSAASLAAIENLIEYREYEKGVNFIERNKRNTKEYFVIDGICKSYLLNPDGENITISFFIQHSILSPYTTRTIKGVSTLNFQALTPVKLAELDASMPANRG